MKTEKQIEEKWVDVNGFREMYQVSNMGRVRSLDRTIINKNKIARFQRGKIISPKINPHGYMIVEFNRDGKGYCKSVHRVVMENFFAINPLKPFINHKNSNRTDNRLINLEWCTHQENMDHMVEANRSASGTRHHSAKLDNGKVAAIKELYKDPSWTHRSLAKLFGVSHSIIGYITKGLAWKNV